MSLPLRPAARLLVAAGVSMAVLALVARPARADSFSFAVSPTHGPATAPLEAWITEGSNTACTDHWWGDFQVDGQDDEAEFSLRHLVTGATLCESIMDWTAFPSSTPGTSYINMVVLTTEGAKSGEAFGGAEYTVDPPPTPTPTALSSATPTPTSKATPVATPRRTPSPGLGRATATPPLASGFTATPAATSTASPSTGPVASAGPVSSAGASTGGIPGSLLAVIVILAVIGVAGAAYYTGARGPAPPPKPPSG